jgi:hypothetical protein
MARRKHPTPTAPGEREQFWRRHLLAAEAKGGTLTEYAAARGLKVGSLYEWRRILRRRGLLGESAARHSTAAAFVPVITAPAQSAAKAPGPAGLHRDAAQRRAAAVHRRARASDAGRDPRRSQRAVMRLRPEGAGQIYLYRHPVDMRKSINGLVAIVEGEMALDPFSASLFVFCNRARTLVKMVGWEGNGFVLWMKRLEKVRFQWPLTLTAGGGGAERPAGELAAGRLRADADAGARGAGGPHRAMSTH